MRWGLWGLPRKNNYKTHLLERPKALGVGVGSLKAEEERVFLWEGCGGGKARQVSPFPSVGAPKLPLPHIKREGPDHPCSNWLEENVLGVFTTSRLSLEGT